MYVLMYVCMYVCMICQREAITHGNFRYMQVSRDVWFGCILALFGVILLGNSESAVSAASGLAPGLFGINIGDIFCICKYTCIYINMYVHILQMHLYYIYIYTYIHTHIICLYQKLHFKLAFRYLSHSHFDIYPTCTSNSRSVRDNDISLPKTEYVCNAYTHAHTHTHMHTHIQTVGALCWSLYIFRLSGEHKCMYVCISMRMYIRMSQRAVTFE
jgi:hypothetical protein